VLRPRRKPEAGSRCRLGPSRFLCSMILCAVLGPIGRFNESYEDTIAQGGPQLSNLVFVTEDHARPNIDGCDAISVHDVESGLVLGRGEKRVSPGRIAVRRDLELSVATASNGCGNAHDGEPPLNGNCDPWLTSLLPNLRRGAIRSG
jgi:hypothetical protein